MKIQYLIILIISLITFVSNSQELETTLYFTDATGQKDSIIIGADANATTSIDEEFGEQNIKSIPFTSGKFEVRIADFYLAMTNMPIPFVNPDLTNFHTKKQIMRKDCGWYYPYYAMIPAILVYHAQYPLIVSWENDDAYLADCYSNSLITNWGPGLWWDAVAGGEQSPFYFNETDSAIFNQVVFRIINDGNTSDTLDLLFFTIAHDSVFILGLPEKIANEATILLYPNPVTNIVQLTIYGRILIPDEIILFDLFGRKVNIELNNYVIDVSLLPSGYYIVAFHYNGKWFKEFIIKS